MVAYLSGSPETGSQIQENMQNDKLWGQKKLPDRGLEGENATERAEV